MSTNTNRPLVSIIMPSYNSQQYIARAIESVLAQTYPHWELLIVDDASQDDTIRIIEQYQKRDPRIKCHIFSSNQGAAKARNKALENARGSYIAFLDSDDIWFKEKLAKQIAFMETNGYSFSASAYELFDEQGNSLHKSVHPPHKIDYRQLIMLSNPLGNLTVMYHKEQLGEFRVPAIKKRNDFALWLQVIKKAGYCYVLDEVLAGYTYQRSNSLSKNKFSLIKYHWQLYRHIEKHSILQSGLEVVAWIFVKIFKIGITIKSES